MNKLILIGNGFDLAHCLKTSYNDFIGGLKFKTILDERCLRSMVNSELLNEIDKDIKNKGWADIEQVYYDLLKTSDSEEVSRIPSKQGPICSLTVNKLNLDMDFLQEELVQYLNNVVKTKEVVRNEEIYEKIYAPIKKEDLLFLQNPSLNMEIERIMLLDFNYTNTADLYVDANRNCEHIHIHGELKNPGSVIFGYGVSDTEYSELLKRNDNNFLVHIKGIKYHKADNYENVSQFIESAPFQVCIMGHSCGNSDRTLLNTIFEHKNCISIKPYYYKRKDGSDEDNYDELKANISRNCNNPKLVEGRVVKWKYCEPLT